MMKFTLEIRDGPMPHKAHQLVYRLEACIKAPNFSELDYQKLLASEEILERALGYRFHIHIEEVPDAKV